MNIKQQQIINKNIELETLNKKLVALIFRRNEETAHNTVSLLTAREISETEKDISFLEKQITQLEIEVQKNE